MVYIEAYSGASQKAIFDYIKGKLHKSSSHLQFYWYLGSTIGRVQTIFVIEQ